MPREQPPPEPVRTYLSVPRDEALQRIGNQIIEAENFLPASERRVTYDDLGSNPKSWADYTGKLLKRLFTTDDLAKEFEWAGHLPFSLRMSSTLRLHKLATIHTSSLARYLGALDPTVSAVVSTKLRSLLTP